MSALVGTRYGQSAYRRGLQVGLLLGLSGVLAAPGMAAADPALAPPRPQRIVVSADGSADVTTIQAALDAVPAGNTSPITIAIRPGVYRGAFTIPADKSYLTFQGLGRNPSSVVIVDDHANGVLKPDGTPYGTSGSATVTISAHDITARNLTFANDFDEAAHPEITSRQAVAVLTRGDRLVFDHVRFLANQDTLYLNSPDVATVSRVYIVDSYIEGDVDFVFGRATAVIESSELRSLDRGSATNNGYVTAASTDVANPHGFLITHSRLTGDTAAGTVSLGRPWHPSGDPRALASVVIRDSYLGAHINPEAWSDFSGGFSWRDARYFEFRNRGPGAVISADRPQLTRDEATAYTPAAYLAGSDGWAPCAKGRA